MSLALINLGTDLVDPFGFDLVDLPLENYCATIDAQIKEAGDRRRVRTKFASKSNAKGLSNTNAQVYQHRTTSDTSDGASFGEMQDNKSTHSSSGDNSDKSNHSSNKVYYNSSRGHGSAKFFFDFQ